LETINWSDFSKAEIRTGTIIKVEAFPEARKPAYKLTVDFGKMGVKKSSVQITELYSEEELIGKQVIGVINFPVKQIGPFMSECLITGFTNNEGAVVLAVPDKKLANGLKLG